MSRGATKMKDELSTFLMIRCECVRYMQDMEVQSPQRKPQEIILVADSEHGPRIGPPRDLYGSSPCRIETARYSQDRKLGFPLCSALMMEYFNRIALGFRSQGYRKTLPDTGCRTRILVTTPHLTCEPNFIAL